MTRTSGGAGRATIHQVPQHITFNGVEYRCNDLLGRGSYGSAYLFSTDADEQVCVKVPMPNLDLAECDNPVGVECDFATLAAPKGYQSSQYFSVSVTFSGESVDALVMPFFGPETLHKKFSKGGFSFDLFSCIRQWLHELKRHHDKGLVHLDMSANNVVVQNGRVVAIDYGRARKVGEPVVYRDYSLGYPPEFFSVDPKASPSMDVFIFCQDLLKHVYHGNLDFLSREFVGLLQRGCSSNPSSRPTISDLLNGLSGYDVDASAVSRAVTCAQSVGCEGNQLADFRAQCNVNAGVAYHVIYLKSQGALALDDCHDLSVANPSEFDQNRLIFVLFHHLDIQMTDVMWAELAAHSEWYGWFDQLFEIVKEYPAIDFLNQAFFDGLFSSGYRALTDFKLNFDLLRLLKKPVLPKLPEKTNSLERLFELDPQFKQIESQRSLIFYLLKNKDRLSSLSQFDSELPLDMERLLDMVVRNRALAASLNECIAAVEEAGGRLQDKSNKSVNDFFNGNQRHYHSKCQSFNRHKYAFIESVIKSTMEFSSKEYNNESEFKQAHRTLSKAVYSAEKNFRVQATGQLKEPWLFHKIRVALASLLSFVLTAAIGYIGVVASTGTFWRGKHSKTAETIRQGRRKMLEHAEDAMRDFSARPK